MFFLNKQWKNVLGMNARMLDYIAKSNSPEAIRIANNKLATKKTLQTAGVGTPRLFGVIKNRQELKNFRFPKLPPSFVLKPSSSSGGGGIIVIFGRNKKGNWVKADKSEIFIPHLKSHILDILDGNFSKSGVPDVAFFEQRIKVHHDLKKYTVKGVPDIRVLIYNGVPVMAMLRLSTESSGGRANLHAGGVGVGIDLSTGLTTHAIQRGQLIESLPDSRLPLSGIQLPFWDDILLLAIRSAEAIGLNYTGVDVAIDREDGPVILEVNARPGLDIQFANLAPLKSRLKRVEGLSKKSIGKRLSLTKNLFGDDVEQGVEDASGRSILGIEEQVTLFDHQNQEHKLLAKIDTGAYRTTIDENLARRLSVHQPIIDHKDVRGALGKQTRPVVNIKMSVKNRTFSTEVFLADRTHMNYDMILGRRDMRGFLVDPSKQVRPDAVIK